MSGGRKRVLISAVLVIVCVSFAAWILVVSNERPALVKYFPDGSSISVGSISYGRTNIYISGNVWQKAVLRLWPRLTWVGGKVHAYTNSTDTAFVFLRYSRPWPVLRVPTARHITISDEPGNEFSYHGAVYRAESSNELVQGFELKMLPHLARDFRLRVAFHDDVLKTNFNAEFQLANPAPPTTSRWQASALPITNDLGGVKIVLRKLTPFRANSSGRPDVNGPDMWTGIAVDFQEDGHTSINWGVSLTAIQDEARNTYWPPVSGWPGSGLEFRDAFIGALSPHEAWKLSFDVARTNDFNADELWTMRGLPVPSAQQTFQPISFWIQAFNVQIDQFTRRGLRLTIAPFPTGVHWVFRLNDAEGTHERIKWLSTGVRNSMNQTQLTYSFDIPDAIMSVDLTFSLTQGLPVEFLVKPDPPGLPPAGGK